MKFESERAATKAIYAIRVYDSHRGVSQKDLRPLQVSPKRWQILQIHPNGRPELVPEDEIVASQAAKEAIQICRAFGTPFPRVHHA